VSALALVRSDPFRTSPPFTLKLRGNPGFGAPPLVRVSRKINPLFDLFRLTPALF